MLCWIDWSRALPAAQHFKSHLLKWEKTLKKAAWGLSNTLIERQYRLITGFAPRHSTWTPLFTIIWTLVPQRPTWSAQFAGALVKYTSITFSTQKVVPSPETTCVAGLLLMSSSRTLPLKGDRQQRREKKKPSPPLRRSSKTDVCWCRIDYMCTQA